MTERPSSAFLFALVAVTAIGPLSMQIFLPALPIIQADYGVSPAVAQLALSISMISIALATLAYGPLSDRFGRRPVMIAGMLIFLAGSAICTFAPNVWLLILGRIVQAAGGTCGLVLARAIVRDVYAEEKVASVIAYLTIAMVVAPMVAPALGGGLTAWLSWRAIFAFVGLIGVGVLALVLLRLAETNSRPASHPGVEGMLEGFAMLLRSPVFCGYAFSGAFGLASFFAFASGAPYVMVNVLGRPVTEYGLYFVLLSLAFMAGNFAAARLSERVGRHRMILTGNTVSLSAVTLAAALALGGVWTPLAIFLPTAAIVFGNGMAMPNLQAGALAVRPRSAGTASGLMGFLQMAVAAFFAQAVGSLTADTPYPMIAFMFTGLSLAFLSFVLAHRASRVTA